MWGTVLSLFMFIHTTPHFQKLLLPISLHQVHITLHKIQLQYSLSMKASLNIFTVDSSPILGVWWW